MACQTPLPLSQTLASEMTLFALDESLSLLMESATEMAAENNGEIPEELRQALLDYFEAFGTKVDNIANYIKSQENEARNAKLEIDRLQSRLAAAENRVDRLKGLLKYFMETRRSSRHEGPAEHDFPSQKQPGLADPGQARCRASRVLARLAHTRRARTTGVAEPPSRGPPSARTIGG